MRLPEELCEDAQPSLRGPILEGFRFDHETFGGSGQGRILSRCSGSFVKRLVKFMVIGKHFELCYLFERRARPLCDVVVPRTLSDASLGQWDPRLIMIMKV